MGVYVKDVTAPKNCTGCIAVHYYMSMAGDAGMLCEVTGLSMDDYYSDGRPDWCPLIEVPEPHGRLGDLDALMLKIREYIDEYGYGELDENGFHSEKWCAMKEAEMAIEDAPTVIPASEEGET